MKKIKSFNHSTCTCKTVLDPGDRRLL